MKIKNVALNQYDYWAFCPFAASNKTCSLMNVPIENQCPIPDAKGLQKAPDHCPLEKGAVIVRYCTI